MFAEESETFMYASSVEYQSRLIAKPESHYKRPLSYGTRALHTLCMGVVERSLRAKSRLLRKLARYLTLALFTGKRRKLIHACIAYERKLSFLQ